MAKHAGVNESEVKAAIAAITKRNSNIAQLRHAERTRLIALRRKLGKQLQTEFADAGLDIKKINKILAEHQREVLSVRAEEKSKTAKAAASAYASR